MVTGEFDLFSIFIDVVYLMVSGGVLAGTL